MGLEEELNGDRQGFVDGLTEGVSHIGKGVDILFETFDSYHDKIMVNTAGLVTVGLGVYVTYETIRFVCETVNMIYN